MKFHNPLNLHRSRDLDVFNITTGEMEGIDFTNPMVCHGGKGGGGTNTVTSSAPPPQVMAAYQTALTAGQNAAAAPLQQYNAPTIAGFTPDQTSAFGTINAAQGAATPYYNQASSDINAGTSNLWGGVQQFSPSTISQYQNPYTSQVLNSTMAAENNQDAQQQQALKGNAVSSGAWGGDRAGVASAILSGQQDIANNQTNANIESQGFTGAEGEFNTQQQAQLGANEANNYLYQQAGLGQANLGSTVENTALSGANAQEASGAVQQQLGQAALNVPYEQFLQQQAYPFQTAQYFANIAEGLGANAGGLGSSSTTAQGPSVGSQVAGFGLGGLGIAGASGAFDSGSTASSASDAVSARGGRIYAAGGAVPQRMAFGGLAARPSFGSGIRASSQIPDLSMTFVPSPTGQGSSGGGHGAGGPPGAQSSTTTGGQKQQSPTTSDASTVIKAGRALHKYLASPNSTTPGDTFSGAADNASTLNTQNFLANGNPDFASTMQSGDPNAAFGATPDATGSTSPLLQAPNASSGLTSDATGAFGTGDASGAASGTAAADTAGGSGAFDAASTSAAADAAGAAAGDAGATAATAGVTDALGAGSLAGAIDGATVEAAVDGAITDAAASVVGESLASYAPLLLLAAKRGGRINGGMGTRKRYDDGGAVAPANAGGQTPMQAGMPTQSPTDQVYNSSYQNMSPEQLQQILTRLPAGSPQQQSAQKVLNTKRMLPNVGQAPQGGFGSQQPAPQAYADGGDVIPGDMPVTPGGFADDSDGILLSGPPPSPMQTPIPAADLAAQSPMSKALTGVTENAVRPAKPKMTPIPSPSAAGQPATGGFGTQQAGPDADISITGGDKVASNETPPQDDAEYDPNGKAKHIETNPWLALARAGFSAAAGQSPNALTNLGKGAEAGVNDYENQKSRVDSVNAAADKLMNEAKQHKESLAIEQQKADEAARHNLVEEKQGKNVVVPGLLGSQIYNSDTGWVAPPGGSQAGAQGTKSPEEVYMDQQAQAAVDGKIQITPQMKFRAPVWNLIEQKAQQLDSNYSDSRYANIQKYNFNANGGVKEKGLDTVVPHIQMLRELADAMDTGNVELINNMNNKFQTKLGLSTPPANLQAAAQLVGNEMVNSTVAGPNSGALGDREEVAKNINGALSTKILKSNIDNVYLPALRAQANATGNLFTNLTGLSRDKFRARLLPQTQQALWGGGGGEDAAPRAAPNAAAIKALQANPSKASEFEQYYGTPASQYLGRP